MHGCFAFLRATQTLGNSISALSVQMDKGLTVIEGRVDQLSNDFREGLESLEDSIEDLKGTIQKGISQVLRGQLEQSTKACRECYRKVSSSLMKEKTEDTVFL